MQLEEVMNIINDIENYFPVDQWVIKDVDVWPIVRIHLMFQLQYHNEACFHSSQPRFYSFALQASRYACIWSVGGAHV